MVNQSQSATPYKEYNHHCSNSHLLNQSNGLTPTRLTLSRHNLNTRPTPDWSSLHLQESPILKLIKTPFFVALESYHEIYLSYLPGTQNTMPSSLRFQLPVDTKKVSTSQLSSPLSPRPVKKARMSLSQTYYIASTARGKLGKEAVKADHNLRRLVGHANLLDALMLELRDAERSQEAWFNRSVASARREEDQHMQWAESIEEEDSDDSDSDADEEDYNMTIPLRRLRSPPVTFSSQSIDEDDEVFEDVDDLPELALTRTSSHPPELVHDSDSEDESPPTSPPQEAFEQFSSEKTVLNFSMHTGKPSQSTMVQSAPMISAY